MLSRPFYLQSITVLVAVLTGVGFAFFSLGPQAEAQGGAVLKVLPASGTFFVGKTFDVSVVVDTGPQAINAVAVELRFPPDILQVTNPTAASSIVSIWATPPQFSNEQGVVRLQGGIPAPGVKTSQGVVTTLTFRAMRPGAASLVFTGNSQVLASDGRGTNILSLTIGATYRIELPPPEGPAVSSPTHPDQNAWYRSDTPTLQWIQEEGVSDFAWSLDQDAGGTANTAEPKGISTATSFENLDDGLWYFHIRAKKGPNWGGVTTFLLRIDASPPAAFQIEFAPSDITSDRRPFANFVTTDALSGINRYEVRVVATSGAASAQSDTTSAFFVATQPPYRIPELSAGGYDVVVRAYDNAGNAQESIGHLTITAGAIALVSQGLKFGPWFLPWWLVSFFAAGIAVAGTLVWRRQHKRHAHLARKLTSDIEIMREQLRKDFAAVSERVAEEQHLKTRLEEQLQRLEAAKQNGKRGAGMILVFVFSAAALLVAVSLWQGRTGELQAQLLQNSPAVSQEGIPLITTFRGQLGSDELLYIGGTAPPNALVMVSFAQEHQEPLIVETRADKDGRWSYLHSRFLQPGVYRVFARTRDDAGNFSDWGPQITLEVVSRTISVGEVTLSYQTVLGIANVLLILIATILGLMALWFNRRSHGIRQRLMREVHEAETAVQEGFRLLRRDIEKELELVGAADFPSRKFSKEERDQREKLIVDLQAIEERVRKEVEDIERAL